MPFRPNPAMLAEGYALPAAIMKKIFISRAEITHLIASGLVKSVSVAGFPYVDLRSLALYYAVHEPNPVIENLVVTMLRDQLQAAGPKVTSEAKRAAVVAKRAADNERKDMEARAKQTALINK